MGASPGAPQTTQGGGRCIQRDTEPVTATQGKAMAQGGTVRLRSKGKQLLLPWPGSFPAPCMDICSDHCRRAGNCLGIAPSSSPLPLSPPGWQSLLCPAIPDAQCAQPHNTWRKSWRPHSCQHSLQQCF